MDGQEFTVTLWGVRGSCPVTGSDTVEFGGNTPCVEMNIGVRTLIFDAGTGIRRLGKNMMSSNNKINADIFFSHYHWDHIQGLPLYSPLYQRENTFRLYGESKNNLSFEKIIKAVIKPPYFPVSWEDVKSNTSFINIKSGEKIDIGDDITIETITLNHPGGSLGYRVKYHEKSCCYITDIEHTEDDSDLVDFIRDSDLLIMDATFSNKEYEKGWGHTTWKKTIEIATASSVKKLVLFHHNMDYTDKELEETEQQGKKLFVNLKVAREGMKISISKNREFYTR